jgi:hypothetical protein
VDFSIGLITLQMRIGHLQNCLILFWIIGGDQYFIHLPTRQELLQTLCSRDLYLRNMDITVPIQTDLRIADHEIVANFSDTILCIEKAPFRFVQIWGYIRTGQFA